MLAMGDAGRRKGAGLWLLEKKRCARIWTVAGLSTIEAVFTMEAMDALSLPFANVVVKNLFLRDDKKRNYYLVVMPEDKPANLKALRAALGARPLRFASEEDFSFFLLGLPLRTTTSNRTEITTMMPMTMLRIATGAPANWRPF